MLLEDRGAMDGKADGSIVILVSLRPRSYSDAIGMALRELMPHRAVRVVEPRYVENLAQILHPVLVLCSQPRPSPSGPPWVEYYPYAESSEDELRINGRSLDRRRIDLADLFALVDDVLAA